MAIPPPKNKALPDAAVTFKKSLRLTFFIAYVSGQTLEIFAPPNEPRCVILAPAEKVIFVKLLKNAQMQGARGAFHLPVRQAILRVNGLRPLTTAVRRNDEG